MNAGLWLAVAGTLVAAASGVPVLLLPRRPTLGHRLAAIAAVLAALLGLAGAGIGLAGGSTTALLPWSLPGGELALGLDGLSALLLLPVFLVPGLAAIYGLGYAPAGSHGRSLRLFQGLMTAGMATVVLARNSMLLLFGWEVMALAAFFLIASEHRQLPARRAAWVYLVATHFCTLCLIAALLLLGGSDGRLDWQPGVLAAMPQGRAVAVFVLALLGFGLKAGLMPLHVWLPAAHATAPSHVSAVLSGVMLKLGIYGLLRVLSLLPPLPLGCGVTVLVLGSVSALLGIAATLGQGEIKRLLAYSSIDNLGIVGIGIGLAMLGRSSGRGDLVALGLGGALFHALNHSLFKPLLFFAAGAVMHATGRRELDQLGGLWRRLPRTAPLFLVGAMAIGGLPLWNGFAGEFVLYRGLFAAAATGSGWQALLAMLVLAALAMVSGLVLLTFARCWATVFLGRPRSAAAAAAHEAPASMTLPMLLLAAACALLGLLPWLSIAPLDAAIASSFGPAPSLAALVPFTAISGLGLATAAALLLVLWWLRQRARRSAAVTVGTWDCGYVDAGSPRLQYTAASLAESSARVLHWAVRVREERPARLGLFAGARAFHSHATEPLLHGLLWPLLRALAARCSQLRFLQRGRLQIYLLYILVVLLLLLGWSAWHGAPS